MVPRIHFMHHHALLQDLNSKEYLCGGCKTGGNGLNFGCKPCSFYMHEFCSSCPPILSSFLHPEHPLRLMISNTQYSAPPRICDVCKDTVEGQFYWCQTCDFNVHPICTKFPQSLCHTVHFQHRLMFQKSYRDAPCCLCGAVCNSWRYRCGYCDGFDVHADCVAKSYEAKSHDTTTRRLPPYAGIYSYGGVNSTANSYNVYKPPLANDQTTPPYMYSPYGWASSSVCTYGTVPHGTYAQKPNNFYGEMPVNMNSYNTYYPFPGLPVYNPHNGAPFDSNSQHVQIHHGDTSHQAPAHNAQTGSAQGQGNGKHGSRIFRIVSALGLAVLSNVIADAIT